MMPNLRRSEISYMIDVNARHGSLREARKFERDQEGRLSDISIEEQRKELREGERPTRLLLR